jgi:hypothetical protein
MFHSRAKSLAGFPELGARSIDSDKAELPGSLIDGAEYYRVVFGGLGPNLVVVCNCTCPSLSDCATTLAHESGRRTASPKQKLNNEVLTFMHLLLISVLFTDLDNNLQLRSLSA